MTAAETSRQNPGVPFAFSSTRLDMRNNDSPRKVPPIPLAIWSFLEGRVVSPAISHITLPAKVYPSDSQ
jgi:hypothetical protein